jgi:hypothetical protein
MGAAGGDDAVIVPPGLLAEPLHQIGRILRLLPGLGDRLALLLRHHWADRAGAVAHDDGGTAQQRAALEGRRLPPGRESPLRGSQGQLEVGRPGFRDPEDRLARGRIQDRQERPVRAVAPHVVDQ